MYIHIIKEHIYQEWKLAAFTVTAALVAPPGGQYRRSTCTTCVKRVYTRSAWFYLSDNT